MIYTNHSTLSKNPLFLALLMTLAFQWFVLPTNRYSSFRQFCPWHPCAPLNQRDRDGSHQSYVPSRHNGWSSRISRDRLFVFCVCSLVTFIPLSVCNSQQLKSALPWSNSGAGATIWIVRLSTRKPKFPKCLSVLQTITSFSISSLRRSTYSLYFRSFISESGISRSKCQ